MYRETATEDPQLVFEFAMPFGGKLNPENRWVKKRKEIPWSFIEELYKPLLSDSEKGYPAHSSSVAFGSLYIQEFLGLTDRETVAQITENPYLQYFIGYKDYQLTAPFDHSLLVTFRKRFSEEMLAAINERIVSDALGLARDPDDESTQDDQEGGQSPDVPHADSKDQHYKSTEEEQSENKGQLLVDATCTPGDIPFPTDLGLLNEAREKSEEIIDRLHEPFIGERRKPRTYRQQARKQFVGLIKQRKPKQRKIRKAIRKQLGYVRRNLSTIDKMISQESSLELLDKRLYKLLLVIREVYNQQQYMYTNKTHRVDDRIVNIYQPHLRPIVRGKAGTRVEFGAKISISLIDGYSFVDRLSWDAYNESEDLIIQIESYRQRYGFYPESVHADKLYRTKANRAYCKSKGIRLSGPGPGRPPKVTEENQAALKAIKQQQHQDECDRQAVEGKFGQGKRRFSLSQIMTKLAQTSTTVIMMSFIVMNVEKIVRDFLFVIFLVRPKEVYGVESVIQGRMCTAFYAERCFDWLHMPKRRMCDAA